MAIPAFLIPALTGFAMSKLTGASTKNALKSALLGATVGGITSGFGAESAAKGVGAGADQIKPGGMDAANGPRIMDSIKSAFNQKAFSLSDQNYSYGDVAKVGVPAALLYKSFVDSNKAPQKSLFYGANVNYANPAIYNQVGPPKFKVGEYNAQGTMTSKAIPGSENYVPPEAVYASGQVPGMPYQVAEQFIRAKEGGLATLRGIKKYNIGGQVLPSKITHNENDYNNYVRANGYVLDNTGNGNKNEDTVLAQLADGEFVTRTDGVLGAGIIAGANPNNIKQMREKGAKYFYEQQARFKRVFDLLQQSKAEAA